jgi:type VI secretion system lysozyme-like protein
MSVDSLLRDIENLLNTWSAAPDELLRHEHASHSLLAYGAPPPMALSMGTYEQKQQVARQLEDVLTRFEPRFEAVRVRVLDCDGAATNGRFAIEAKLRHDTPGELSADLDLKLDHGRIHVTAKNGNNSK